MTTSKQTDPIRRILIVEDEALIRWCTSGVIEDAGYAVVEADNADAALRILEERDDIDCLFTDVDMPGSMDGLALARLVHDRWPRIRIVVTSGKQMPSAGQMPPGGRFLSKPYQPLDIVAALGKIAPGPSRTPYVTARQFAFSP